MSCLASAEIFETLNYFLQFFSQLKLEVKFYPASPNLLTIPPCFPRGGKFYPQTQTVRARVNIPL